MTISLNGQVDVVDEGFQTSPDTVYGVLVGTLIAFGVGAVGFFVWIFRKVFGWLDEYRKEKAQGEASKAQTFADILSELQQMNRNQAKQGQDIVEIKEDIEGVKKDVHTLKEDVERLKGC